MAVEDRCERLKWDEGALLRSTLSSVQNWRRIFDDIHLTDARNWDDILLRILKAMRNEKQAFRWHVKRWMVIIRERERDRSYLNSVFSEEEKACDCLSPCDQRWRWNGYLSKENLLWTIHSIFSFTSEYRQSDGYKTREPCRTRTAFGVWTVSKDRCNSLGRTNQSCMSSNPSSNVFRSIALMLLVLFIGLSIVAVVMNKAARNGTNEGQGRNIGLNQNIAPSKSREERTRGR